jgi:para-nitrobenzyl esterase
LSKFFLIMKICSLVAFWSLVLLPYGIDCQTTEISVDGGKIEGYVTKNNEVLAFKGIPFAQAPVGDLRWKTPQPVKPWSGVLSCKAFGPSPYQGAPRPFSYWPAEFLIPEAPISEDCLYLNVWSSNKSVKNKPVIVYTYGGGFRSGGAGCAIYDGEAMAAKDVVFVTFNYRVGVFGFFAHPELTAESPTHSSSNYALHDVVAALKWVQRNISKFGGDPNNVTLAGQSAGSMAISMVASSGQAKGLFHKLVGQSGGSFSTESFRPLVKLSKAEDEGKAFMQRLGKHSLQELRALPSDALLQANFNAVSPIIDGHLITQSNMEAYKNGAYTDVPYMLGWNKDDKVISSTIPNGIFIKDMQKRFGNKYVSFVKAYNLKDTFTSQIQYDLNRDMTFGIQMLTWAKLQARYGKAPVYVYNFQRDLPSYDKATAFGAFHSGEITYLYDNLHTIKRPMTTVDEKIADNFSAYLVNFAKTGNPNGGKLKKWQPFNLQKNNAQLVDVKIKNSKIPTLDKLIFLEDFMGLK